MKALKEKRLSLRSFLRRGLVILSLFALVFALASCGESGSGDDTTTGGGNTTNPTAAPLPRVVSIKIIEQPKNPSFQGCQPDISDVVIQVLYDNSPDVKTYTGDEIRAAGLFPSPDYCDTPGKTDAEIGKFFIGAYSGGAPSQQLKIPGVIALTSAEVTGGAPVKVYSDQKPDFSKVTVKGKYAYDDTDDNRYLTTAPTSIPDSTGKIEYKTIPITFGIYPPIVLDMDVAAAEEGGATVYIGANFAPNPAGSPPAGITQSNKIEIPVDVALYQVSGIVFEGFGSGSDGYAFDDDVDKYVTEESPSFANFDNISELLAGAKFTVRYETAGRNPTPDPDYPNGRSITWEEFQLNMEYAIDTYTFDEYDISKVIVGTDGVYHASDGSFTRAGDPTKVLNWNDAEGDAIWNIKLQYVPKEYVLQLVHGESHRHEHSGIPV